MWQAITVMGTGLVVFFVGAISNSYRSAASDRRRRGLRAALVVGGMLVFVAGVALLWRAVVFTA